MTNPSRKVRISTLQEQGLEDDLKDTTPSQRVDMMWQLAVDAWALMGVADAPMDRHVVRVIRGKQTYLRPPTEPRGGDLP